MTEKNLSKDEADRLASVVVDFRVTRLVDGVTGVHGMIPRASSWASDAGSLSRPFSCTAFAGDDLSAQAV